MSCQHIHFSVALVTQCCPNFATITSPNKNSTGDDDDDDLPSRIRHMSSESFVNQKSYSHILNQIDP